MTKDKKEDEFSEQRTREIVDMEEEGFYEREKGNHERRGKREKVNMIRKWREMTQPEAIVWAHLRLDRIEEALKLSSGGPDLRKITDKLHEEATDKETYSPNGEHSLLSKTLTKWWVIVIVSCRHLFNRIFRSNHGDSQNQASNEGKAKTNDI